MNAVSSAAQGEQGGTFSFEPSWASIWPPSPLTARTAKRQQQPERPGARRPGQLALLCDRSFSIVPNM